MAADSVGCISCVKPTVRPLRYVEKESAFNSIKVPLRIVSDIWQTTLGKCSCVVSDISAQGLLFWYKPNFICSFRVENGNCN